nr:MAG TPA: hypothetical protein [Caudoviricetes sp.]
MHFLPNCVRVVCILFANKTGLPRVYTFCLLRLSLWCPPSVCTFSQSTAKPVRPCMHTK